MWILKRVIDALPWVCLILFLLPINRGRWGLKFPGTSDNTISIDKHNVIIRSKWVLREMTLDRVLDYLIDQPLLPSPILMLFGIIMGEDINIATIQPPPWGFVIFRWVIATYFTAFPLALLSLVKRHSFRICMEMLVGER